MNIYESRGDPRLRGSIADRDGGYSDESRIRRSRSVDRVDCLFPVSALLLVVRSGSPHSDVITIDVWKRMVKATHALDRLRLSVWQALN
jgi:hypothetical protein